MSAEWVCYFQQIKDKKQLFNLLTLGEFLRAILLLRWKPMTASTSNCLQFQTSAIYAKHFSSMMDGNKI